MATVTGGDVEARATTHAVPPLPSNPRFSASANLLELLPSGTVMAYQMLASPFSNRGKCHASNWYITMMLLVMLTFSCVFSVLTDSIIHNGKVYQGLAGLSSLRIFNLSKAEQADIAPVLEKRRLQSRDIIHAFLVVLVFLGMAFSDVGIQNCFFPLAGTDTQQLLKNLPLGIGVLASAIFIILPTRRKFIGTSDPAGIPTVSPPLPVEPLPRPPPNPRPSASANPRLSASANLVQLLPSGTVMAYQMLASSFSNGGQCHASNWYITMVLLVLLVLSCIFSVFTDFIIHNGKVYQGLAGVRGLRFFNLSRAEQAELFADITPELEKRRLQRRDFVHATVVVWVFLAMAFSDVGIQNCFFPKAGIDTQELLKNLPLGTGVLASAIFIILPTRRKFIGTSDPAGIPTVSQSFPQQENLSYPLPRESHPKSSYACTEAVIDMPSPPPPYPNSSSLTKIQLDQTPAPPPPPPPGNYTCTACGFTQPLPGF